MGPMLVGLGLANFTAHMFVFYFAVASAITPPVAVAAFAASTITNADPMKTGFSAVKSGIVMFTIPFVFAIYPELLLIDSAVIDPASGLFLDGYNGEVDYGWLALLICRIVLALFLAASALAGFDRKSLTGIEIIIRIFVGILILAKPVEIYGTAILIGIGILVLHFLRSNEHKTVQPK